jgi:hypothetical protein
MPAISSSGRPFTASGRSADRKEGVQRTEPHPGDVSGARVGRGVLLAVLGAAWLLGSAGPASGQCPTALSSEEARRVPQDYAWVHHEFARQELEKKAGRLSPEDLDRVIARLKVAIRDNPASKSEMRIPGNQYIEYFPYFYLGWAYFERDDLDAAFECMSRDEGKGASAKITRKLAELKGEIVRGRQRQQFDVLIADWTRWVEGAGFLSAQAREAAVAIGRAAQGASVADPQAKFAGDVVGWVRGEMTSLQAELRTLASSEWDPAFDRRAFSVDACAPPAEAGSLDAVEPAKSALQQCAGVATEALRAAGSGACDTLARQREDLRGKIGVAASYGATAEASRTGSTLPRSCDTDWGGRSLEQLRADVAAVEFPTNHAGLQSDLQSVQAQLSVLQRDYRNGLAEALEGIPEIASDCARQLSLGADGSRLRELRAELARAVEDPDLAPSTRWDGIDDEVSRLLAGIGRRAVESGQATYKNRDFSTELDQTLFEAIPPAMTPLQGRDVSGQAIANLCTLVRRAENEFNRVALRDTGQLEDQLRDYRWLLGQAGARTALGDLEEVGCIGESLRAMPRSVGRSLQAVTGASETIRNARTCFADYEAAYAARIQSVRSELQELDQAFAGMAGKGTSEISTRIDAARSEVQAEVDALARLDPLLGYEGGEEVESLRRLLDAADLTVPQGRWDSVESLGEALVAQGLRAVRDEAIEPSVGRAAGVATGYRPYIAKLGTYLVVEEALTAYAAGDLDRAIEALRSAPVPVAGSAEPGDAIRYTTLAFLLHAKWMSLEQDQADSRVTKMLIDDARFAARRALEIEQEIDLPAFLSRGDAFVRFFETCRAM